MRPPRLVAEPATLTAECHTHRTTAKNNFAVSLSSSLSFCVQFDMSGLAERKRLISADRTCDSATLRERAKITRERQENGSGSLANLHKAPLARYIYGALFMARVTVSAAPGLRTTAGNFMAADKNQTARSAERSDRSRKEQKNEETKERHEQGIKKKKETRRLASMSPLLKARHGWSCGAQASVASRKVIMP